MDLNRTLRIVYPGAEGGLPALEAPLLFLDPIGSLPHIVGMSNTPKMVFESYGRSPHLRIRSAADLEHVLALEEAHWVATGAPISSLNCDGMFLDYIDVDDNGRIMCFEVRQAIRWLFDCVKDRAGIDRAASVLKLDAINTDHDDGKKIHSSAAKMLKQLGVQEPTEIGLDQIRKLKKKVEEKPVSAEGVALPEAAGDDDTRKFIEDIIGTVGGASHSEGKEGVDEKKLDEFLKESKLYLEWHAKGVVPKGADKSDIAPLGAGSEDAFALYTGLLGKIDEYFAQSRAAAFDKRAIDHMKPVETDLQSANLTDPKAIEALLKTCPLSRPDPKRSLPLKRDVNPAYESQLAKLRETVFTPALGHAIDVLSEDDWAVVKEFFAKRQAWMDAKAGGAVEKLGAAKLAGDQNKKYEDAVRDLIADSKKTALVLDNIRLVEQLILYQAHMLSLVNNFVSFPLLYDPERRALFEMGTLIIDGRCLNFAVKAENRAAHSSVAKTSDIFVIYIEVYPGNGDKKYELALPVTSGSKGNLCVGKRGVFCDLHGNMQDAKVVQIIENPISICEAMISPFQRMGKLLTGKIEAITTSAEKKLDSATTGALAGIQKGPEPTPGAPQGKGLLAGGLLMGGGVAVAALGSAVAYITNTFRGVETYKIILGVFLAIVAVITPASLIALMKLRRRDLSAILEGSGWAINARMRLTLRQGRIFTRKPPLPEGSVRTDSPLPRILTWLGVAVVCAFIVARIASCAGDKSVPPVDPSPAARVAAPAPAAAAAPAPASTNTPAP